MDTHRLHYLTLFMFSFSDKAIEKTNIFTDRDIFHIYLMATYRTRNSNLIDHLGRSRDGRITQDCRSTLHNKLTPVKTFTVYDIKRGKKFKQSIVNYMREKKMIGPKSNYLCTICSDFAEQSMKGKSESPIEESNQTNEINIDTDTESVM